MKKPIVLLVILSLVLTLGLTSVYAEEPIKVSVNGTMLNFDVNPSVIEGRTLVPLRAIFEALGAEIQWESNTKTVTAIKGDSKIILEIGSKYAVVNGEKKELEVEGRIIDERAMVPARFIAESLGASVDWNAEEKAVVITSKPITEGSDTVNEVSTPNEKEEVLDKDKDTDSISEEEAILMDFMEYIAEMENLGLGDLEDKAVNAFNNVIGENAVSDEVFHNTIKKEVIPTYSEFLAGLEKIHPETAAIAALHKIYIEGAKANLDAFNLILQAIEKDDMNLLTQADEKMDKATALISQWEAKTNEYTEAISEEN